MIIILHVILAAKTQQLTITNLAQVCNQEKKAGGFLECNFAMGYILMIHADFKPPLFAFQQTTFQLILTTSH
jgi:hypothetical protein